MNKIGSKIYFDNSNGNVLLRTSEMQGSFIETTLEDDIKTFEALKGRVVETFDVIKLDYGQHSEEFSTCTGYRVNPEVKQLEFFYGEDTARLEGYKQMKINNLKRLCEETIEAGFTSAVNGHVYRTNRDDQANFMGQKEEVNDKPELLTVPWKTEDVGYIEHSRGDWITIFYEGLQHKKNQLYKYDYLKQQVLSDTTDTEAKVDTINW